ncbi:MAG: hypothetical protein ACK5MZ_01540 [Aestuariibaculum sp.]
MQHILLCLWHILEVTIYEIDGENMKKTALDDTSHYSVTKNFLNNPNAFLRDFD